MSLKERLSDNNDGEDADNDDVVSTNHPLMHDRDRFYILRCRLDVEATSPSEHTSLGKWQRQTCSLFAFRAIKYGLSVMPLFFYARHLLLRSFPPLSFHLGPPTV